MYSRSSPKPPYVGGLQRGPSYQRGMRVPPNYSGTAIGGPPPDGVPPATDGLSLPEILEENRQEEPMEDHIYEPSAPPEATEKTPNSSMAEVSRRGSPLEGFLSGKHFPFGHGLGYEELVLLGLILFLLKEGEGQSREDDLYVTVALLGLLLFCG